MTIDLRAVETTYRCIMGNAQFLESQFLHDAAARLVAVEEYDADCPRTKVPERVPDSCVCGLCRHAPSGVLRRCPVSCLIDILLVGEVQCGSNNKIPVDPMESGQSDSCLILVVHHAANRIFHRFPRPLVVEGPSHPKLQIAPRFFLSGLDRIQIVKRWRTQDQAWRYDRHQMAHRVAQWKNSEIYLVVLQPDASLLVSKRRP